MTEKRTSDAERFARLPADGRRWAVAAVHGEADRLRALHRAIEERLQPGDGIIYLGNYLGHGPAVLDTIDELLLFRRAMMARLDTFCRDVVFLRGMQEEMWHKLLQIQFATDPRQVLRWMLGHGADATLRAYGSSGEEGIAKAQEGHIALAQWTSRLRDAVRRHDGHNALMSALRRAAYTENNGLLFVSTGIDPTRPLDEQTDSFWWGARDFEALAGPYGAFGRIVRGFDPRHAGPAEADWAVTIDGGCGFDGSLNAVCFDAASGAVVERIEI